LSEAITELDANGPLIRPTAKRAIVLFTDGVSNRPLPSSGSDTAALNQGTAASAAGIPVYTIGLSQNAQILTKQNNLLGDSAASNGIAYRSGHNAIYVNVSNSSQLDQAFQTIARSLCAIH